MLPLFQDAFIAEYHGVMWFLLGTSVAAAIAVFLLMDKRRRQDPHKSIP